MQEYGFLSVIPPLIAIFLAIRTKQVFISLLTGIFIGWLIIGKWNILSGVLLTIDGIVNVFQDPGNSRVIIFTFLVGSLITFIQVSGGVAGFVNSVKKYFNSDENKINKSRKNAQLFDAFTVSNRKTRLINHYDSNQLCCRLSLDMTLMHAV